MDKFARDGVHGVLCEARVQGEVRQALTQVARGRCRARLCEGS